MGAAYAGAASGGHAYVGRAAAFCYDRRRGTTAMTYCDFEALERTPLERDPYEFVVVPEFPAPRTIRRK